MENQVILKAVGIVCSGCAMDMETILRLKDGINDVKVNFSDGIIKIDYDPGETNEYIILKMVNELGYESKIISSAELEATSNKEKFYDSQN